MQTMPPLLDVRYLHVAYTTRTGKTLPALSGERFGLEQGETLGVLGESGSGKSTFASALLGLLSSNGSVQKGAIVFAGHDLLRAKRHDLGRIRGGNIGSIFQEPSLSQASVPSCGRAGQRCLGRARTNEPARGPRKNAVSATNTFLNPGRARLRFLSTIN